MECKRCKKELVKDEERGCMYCPSCHPPQKPQQLEEEKERHYVDVRLTEARVRELVRDELENWHIPKPKVALPDDCMTTDAKTKELEAERDTQQEEADWRQQAKELGIPLFQRTKADVLADIKALENV